MENVDFFPFKQIEYLVGTTRQVLISHLWVVVVLSVVPKAFAVPARSVLSVHLPVASLGPGLCLPHSLILKAFTTFFSIISIPGSGVSPRIQMHFMGSFSQAVSTQLTCSFF